MMDFLSSREMSSALWRGRSAEAAEAEAALNMSTSVKRQDLLWLVCSTNYRWSNALASVSAQSLL